MHSQSPQVGLPSITEGNIVDNVDDGASRREELVFRQALIDNVAKNFESAVELRVGGIGNDFEEGREEGRPSVGEVVVCKLAYCITGYCVSLRGSLSP